MIPSMGVAMCCNVLQCVAMCCSVSPQSCVSWLLWWCHRAVLCGDTDGAPQENPVWYRGPSIQHGKKDIVGERGLLKTAFPMNVLQCIATEFTLQQTATHCNTLQHTCCNVLQCIATELCVLATLVVSKAVTMIPQCFVVCCSVLQCAAVCCSVLQ